MQDEGQGLRAILGEEQIALLSRVNQLAGMAEEAFLETVMAEAKGRADPFTALALRCAAGAHTSRSECSRVCSPSSASTPHPPPIDASTPWASSRSTSATTSLADIE